MSNNKGKKESKKYPSYQQEESSPSKSGSPTKNDEKKAEKTELFNENWTKLNSEDKIYAERNFAQLTSWKKRKFDFRNSIIQDLFQETGGSRTRHVSLKGFYHLFILGLGFFLLSHPIINYRKTGRLFNDKFLLTFQRDFLYVMLTWPCFTIWSFWAFFIQKAYAKGLPTWMMFALQHITQCVMFFMCTALIITKDWGVSHTFFVMFQACIHFMKMHSYNEVNYQYSKEAAFCKKKGIPAGTNYPENVNLQNFWYFLVVPVVVYELDYPRKTTRSWRYILERSTLSILTLLSLYLIVEEAIIPVFLLGKEITAFEAIYRLCVPLLFIIVTMFFLVWELILNVIAEITHFGFREFYLDWWNSTTFNEFNRKWNRVVHEWLFRHIYLDFLQRWRIGAMASQTLTFFVSALFHEYIMAVVLKAPTYQLMIFMMLQIPLFAITENMRGTVFGNYFFWWGLVQGAPIVVVCYVHNLFDNQILHNWF